MKKTGAARYPGAAPVKKKSFSDMSKKGQSMCICGHTVEDHQYTRFDGSKYLGRCGACECRVYNPKEATEVTGKRRGRPPKEKEPARKLTEYAEKVVEQLKDDGYTTVDVPMQSSVLDQIKETAELAGITPAQLIEYAVKNELERWIA